MGQTLTHGVYLPDEGERNCYSGLAANWSILDGAVGTIAEHTSALSGKAPLVHTHGKADITDFPVYGNAAGTICEGNDSRLSDARTPVAHTHTKSDVTDLLNSNFIPSANNSYSLGSSSYQWNNLYAKNYYYNGTAWGLDKSNVWTQDQVIATNNDKCYIVKDTVYELGQTYPNGEHLGGLIIQDKNGSVVGLIDITDRSYGSTEMRIRVQQKFDPDSNNRSTNGTILWNETVFGIASNKTNYVRLDANLIGPNHDLGTSTNKWTTLNGINPGALSLPDYGKCVDKTSEIPVASLDGNTEIDINNYFPDLTGWINIVISDTSGNFIRAVQGKAGTTAGFNSTRSFHAGSTGGGFITLFMPIVAGSWKLMKIQASSVTQFRFYPCLGNV